MGPNVRPTGPTWVTLRKTRKIARKYNIHGAKKVLLIFFADISYIVTGQCVATICGGPVASKNLFFSNFQVPKPKIDHFLAHLCLGFWGNCGFLTHLCISSSLKIRIFSFGFWLAVSASSVSNSSASSVSNSKKNTNKNHLWRNKNCLRPYGKIRQRKC